MFPVVQRFHLTPPPARKTSVLRKTCGKHVRVCLLLDIVKLPPWQHISTMRLVLKFMDVHKQKRPNISIRALIRRRTYTDRGNVTRPQMQFTSFWAGWRLPFPEDVVYIHPVMWLRPRSPICVWSLQLCSIVRDNDLVMLKSIQLFQALCEI